MKKKTYLIIIITIAIFGLCLASILTIAKYNNAIAILCGEDTSNSCNVVQTSDYSNIYLFGIKIPLTLLGILFYCSLSLIAYKYYLITIKEEENSILKNILLLFSLFGVLFSLWFIYIQSIIIKAYCKYCLVSAIDTFILLVLILIVYFKED